MRTDASTAGMTTHDISSTDQMSLMAAHDVLVGLGEVTADGDLYALAPQRWIDELHEVLSLIAARDDQRRYRLDRLTGINRSYLHRQVQAVLQDFDRLVAERLLGQDHARTT